MHKNCVKKLSWMPLPVFHNTWDRDFWLLVFLAQRFDKLCDTRKPRLKLFYNLSIKWGLVPCRLCCYISRQLREHYKVYKNNYHSRNLFYFGLGRHLVFLYHFITFFFLLLSPGCPTPSGPTCAHGRTLTFLGKILVLLQRHHLLGHWKHSIICWMLFQVVCCNLPCYSTVIGVLHFMLGSNGHILVTILGLLHLAHHTSILVTRTYNTIVSPAL